MQIPPFSLSDLSLLMAVSAIILVITADIVSPYDGTANLTINKKRLRNAALATSLMFLLTVAYTIISIIFNS